ncbi:MAG: NTP transferase domain-containing protein [Clostridia bacterium]|nr:NTP transferase domain-containing protein [Clostridia bacterium]
MELSENKLIESKLKVKKGVVLAGGLGTRFLPGTLAVAKELVTIGNNPILMYQLQDLLKAGVDDILIVGSKLKEESFRNFITPSEEYIEKITADGKRPLLQEYFDLMKDVKITYLNQYDKVQVIDGKTYENPNYEMRGSSGAVYTAINWTNGEPFVVVNGDDLCIYPDGKSATKEVIDVFAATGKTVEYAKEMPRDQIYKYSAIVFGNPVANGLGFEMLDIVEKPEPGTEPSNFMGFARYVFDNTVFEDILNSKPRANGEYCITDVVQTRAKERGAATCIFDGEYFDCGSKAGYALANAYVGLTDKDSAAVVRSRLKEIMAITERQMLSKKN